MEVADLQTQHQAHKDRMARMGQRLQTTRPVVDLVKAMKLPTRPARQDDADGKPAAPCLITRDLITRFLEDAAPLPAYLWAIHRPIKPTKYTVIEREVAARHYITIEELRSTARHGVLLRARAEVALRGQRELGLSLPQIGLRCGRRDHTTALHSIKKLQAFCAGENWNRSLAPATQEYLDAAAEVEAGHFAKSVAIRRGLKRDRLYILVLKRRINREFRS